MDDIGFFLFVAGVPAFLFGAGAFSRAIWRKLAWGVGGLVALGGAGCLIAAGLTGGWDSIGWYLVGAPAFLCGVSLVGGVLFDVANKRLTTPLKEWRFIGAGAIVFILGWGVCAAFLAEM